MHMPEGIGLFLPVPGMDKVLWFHLQSFHLALYTDIAGQKAIGFFTMQNVLSSTA